MSEKLGELKSLYDDGQNAFYKNTFSDGWDAFESLNIPVKFLQWCIDDERVDLDGFRTMLNTGGLDPNEQEWEYVDAQELYDYYIENIFKP